MQSGGNGHLTGFFNVLFSGRGHGRLPSVRNEVNCPFTPLLSRDGFWWADIVWAPSGQLILSSVSLEFLVVSQPQRWSQEWQQEMSLLYNADDPLNNEASFNQVSWENVLFCGYYLSYGAVISKCFHVHWAWTFLAGRMQRAAMVTSAAGILWKNCWNIFLCEWFLCQPRQKNLNKPKMFHDTRIMQKCGKVQFFIVIRSLFMSY